ncbi:hypothetical protein VNI00_000287 [Paramarasmius palmivorus]|uniref:Alpha/beta hydrolase fold-3 domain-containing protein n=1 Tax=Paramarasmius palmivorus TaxID=297713 RepID=A0AAW0EGC6_9AGAR
MRGSASNIPNSPYPDLDQLYNQLLSRCSDWQATFRILQILITPHKNKSATTAERIAWRSSRVIEGILKLKPGQLGIHLVHLHSVLYIPEDEDSDIHIFHASFTEFLTEHSRSGLYHVEPLQSNQYWDLFAQFLLHMQSLLPFPPYSSENPSHDLVDMLDTFDPYPVFTAILHRQVPIKSFFVKWRYTEWEQCLAWAKSLGPRTPRKFVQVLESFYHGFSIVLPPGSSPYWAYVSSLLELHLSFESHRPRNYFYDELYLKKMSASHSDTVDVYLKPFPFIIPASRLPVIPQDWGKVDITGTEAKEFHTLMNRFVPRNDSETTQRLVQDVLNNTQNTTSTDSNRSAASVRQKSLPRDQRCTMNWRSTSPGLASSNSGLLQRHEQMAEYAKYSQLDPELASLPGVAEFLKPDNATNVEARRQRYENAMDARSSQINQDLLPDSSEYSVVDRYIDVAPGVRVRARCVTPTVREGEDGSFPLLFWIHGGGWLTGDVRMDDNNLRITSVELRLSVVNCEYRLAPEHPFPTGLNDLYAALKYVAANPRVFAASLKKGFIVGGVSAGGNLTAVITHRARDDSDFQNTPLTGQLLRIPCVIHPDAYPEEYKSSLLSMEQNKDAPFLSKAAIDLILNNYHAPPTDPNMSPLLFQSHKALPPAFIQVCGLDPLRDEAFLYQKVLEEAGVEAKLEIYPGVPHIFDLFFPSLKQSKKFLEDFIQGLRWLLYEQKVI